tara:strand:+ start:2410 stop:2964 length:555 start_codon:yes stop_codon:yes gene_type:complete
MKIGIIGLGSVGEGMSRRLIKKGHEVWGYRKDYSKAEEQYENGYISGCVTSIKNLILAVGSSGPGIYMMVEPFDTVEETLNELIQHCGEGDIIINNCNSDTKDPKERALSMEKLGLQYIDTSIGGSVCGLDYGYSLMVSGSNTAVSICSPLFKSISPDVSTSPSINPMTGWKYNGELTEVHHVR